MKKLSNMGGGRFEFNPSEFEARINKRNQAIEDCFNLLEGILAEHSKSYVEHGLGCRDIFEKDVVKKMMYKVR